MRESIKTGLARFVRSCSLSVSEYKLTQVSDPSPFALCFAVFSLYLAQDKLLEDNAGRLASALISNIRSVRRKYDDCPVHKPYRQLLSFTLSALSALRWLSVDPLEELVVEQVANHTTDQLELLGCLSGKPGSGNQAMFIAIFLLHAEQWLGVNTKTSIDDWVDLHLRHMNRFGFWGADRGMTHLQFQNGYHQHEILEYLGVKNNHAENSISAVRSLVDDRGHFAPYPGGGGCYDYDAIFMLTPFGLLPDEETRLLVEATAATLASEQRLDGGFSESLYVRPRSLSNLFRMAAHVGNSLGNMPLFVERFRYGVALQRPKHDRIHTHWSRYSRRWDESDLWDSWFRVLALARIEVALNPAKSADWGFIDYPGIGYHPSLRGKPAKL